MRRSKQRILSTKFLLDVPEILPCIIIFYRPTTYIYYWCARRKGVSCLMAPEQSKSWWCWEITVLPLQGRMSKTGLFNFNKHTGLVVFYTISYLFSDHTTSFSVSDIPLWSNTDFSQNAYSTCLVFFPCLRIICVTVKNKCR